MDGPPGTILAIARSVPAIGLALAIENFNWICYGASCYNGFLKWGNDI
jgi:hypothetical protein